MESTEQVSGVSKGSLSALSGSSFNDVPLMLRGLADIDLPRMPRSFGVP